MLNLLAISILSDSTRITSPVLRFFMRILRDYDLRHYVAIPTTEARELYSTGRCHSRDMLATLVKVGLLEMGPEVKDRAWKYRTYRVSRPLLLRGRELQEWYRENELILHRRRRALRPASDREG